MLNITENLLVTVSEECTEIGKVACKALRFGLDDHHPNEPETTNADEIVTEFLQLTAVIEELQKRGALPKYSEDKEKTIKEDKMKKVTHYQTYSVKKGLLEPNT